MGHGALNHVAWAEAQFLFDSIPSETCACRLDTVATHYTFPDAHGQQDPDAHGHQDPDAHGHQYPHAHGHQDPNARGHQDPDAHGS